MTADIYPPPPPPPEPGQELTVAAKLPAALHNKVMNAPLEAEELIQVVSEHYPQLALLYPLNPEKRRQAKREMVSEVVGNALGMLAALSVISLFTTLISSFFVSMTITSGAVVAGMMTALAFGVASCFLLWPKARDYACVVHTEEIAKALFFHRIAPMSTQDLWALATDEDIEDDSWVTSEWLQEASYAREDFHETYEDASSTSGKIRRALEGKGTEKPSRESCDSNLLDDGSSSAL